MLPDWHSIKKDLAEIIHTAVDEARYSSAPILSQVSVKRYHEGKGGVLVREDGEEDPTELELLSAEGSFSYDELGVISLREVFDRYLKVASEMTQGQSRMLFEVVEKATEKTGNVVDAGGKTFGPDLLLDMIEAIQISFDRNGRPNMPTIAVGGAQLAAFEQALREAEQEPYRSRFDTIIEVKKREWLDREGDRKLVD